MDKERRRPPSAARHALLRAFSALGGGRAGLLRAFLLLLALGAAATTLLRLPLLRLAGGDGALRTPQLREAPRHAAVKLDGRPVAKPLPSVYPNGAPNRFACDLPALRFQCEMDGAAGCRGYPQLFPAADLLRNWSPDRPESPPAALFSSICRFDVSDPYEFRLAQLFHDMEVPFIAYGVPELTAAGDRWTDEYLTAKFSPTQRFKVHVANDSHFMYYKKSAALADEQPTYASEWWTYPEFVDAVAAAKRSPPPGEARAFYYFLLKQSDFAERAAFVYDELRFLDPARARRESPYGDLFIRDERWATDKGMRCRLGMRGIIAEGHVDGGLNMIAMVRGSKRYILSPPSVCACLHLLSRGQSKRHTAVDWSDVDALPADARACPATEVVVGQGDVLYVPSYWYHHIVSLDESVQCNVRSGLALRRDGREFLHACGLTDV